MSNAGPGLAFEQPIYKLEQELESLESEETGNGQSAKVRDLKNRIADVTRDIYTNLSPWETVQVARHQDRPYTRDYLNLVFDEFVELHGDRKFGDDRAMLTGFAKLNDQKVMVIGHQKGRTVKERTE